MRPVNRSTEMDFFDCTPNPERPVGIPMDSTFIAESRATDAKEAFRERAINAWSVPTMTFVKRANNVELIGITT